MQAAMPSMLKWLYQPFAEEGDPEAMQIKQRAYAGDKVNVDGEIGRLDKLDGAVAHVEVLEQGMEGVRILEH